MARQGALVRRRRFLADQRHHRRRHAHERHRVLPPLRRPALPLPRRRPDVPLAFNAAAPRTPLHARPCILAPSIRLARCSCSMPRARARLLARGEGCASARLAASAMSRRRTICRRPQRLTALCRFLSPSIHPFFLHPLTHPPILFPSFFPPSLMCLSPGADSAKAAGAVLHDTEGAHRGGARECSSQGGEMYIH